MKELFEDGDWRLVGREVLGVTGGHPSNIPPWCDIQHRCPLEQGTKNEWWYYCGDKVCTICEEPIPDEMRGLKVLHDWDR